MLVLKNPARGACFKGRTLSEVLALKNEPLTLKDEPLQNAVFFPCGLQMTALRVLNGLYGLPALVLGLHLHAASRCTETMQTVLENLWMLIAQVRTTTVCRCWLQLINTETNPEGLLPDGPYDTFPYV